MRLLVVAPYPIFPTNDGGRVRIRTIATHLSARHDVHLSAPRAGVPEAVPFTYYPAPTSGSAQLIHPRTLSYLRELMRDVRPDAVLLEYMWLAPHVAPMAARAGIAMLLDKPDVDTVRFRRARRRIWPLVAAYERVALRLASHVYAASEVDRDRLVRLGAPDLRTSVVPNGVDSTVFRPGSLTERAAARAALGVSEGDVMLLYFGQLTYAPNADAVRHLATIVMPSLPSEYRLYVAGRGPIEELRAQFGSPRVTFLGPVEAMPPLLWAADAVPAIVAHGSGTRLKILESLACGVPTVTTPVGAEGLDLTVCDGLYVLGEGDDRATAIRRWEQRGHFAPSREFKDRYDWASIIARMEVL